MGDTVRAELLQSGFIVWFILGLMLLLAEIGWRVGNHICLLYTSDAADE